jgi:prevent-host-death family protein
MQINVLEAKNQLSYIIKVALSGEEVVIANRGEPVVQLVPLKSAAPTTPKIGLVAWLAANPLPTHAQRSAAEIDASIADERSAWD